MDKATVCLLLFPDGGWQGDSIVLDRHFDSSNGIEFKSQAEFVKISKGCHQLLTSFH